MPACQHARAPEPGKQQSPTAPERIEQDGAVEVIEAGSIPMNRGLPVYRQSIAG